eukprot:1091882-Prymnesium_polylepis.1
MNAIASDVIAPYGIEVVDLYSTVTKTCGAVYVNCSICRKEPCSYHYNAAGMEAQGRVVAQAIERALSLGSLDGRIERLEVEVPM